MSLRIAILTIDIGTGLANDALILGSALSELGHSVEIREMRKWPVRYTRPDCAIFMERFTPRWVGRFNVLIPNHEWIRPGDVPLLGRFELVACKTREARRCIGGVAEDRLVDLGFTSLDRFRGEVAPNFDECLHIAGCSAQKGTSAVLAAWEQNPDLPHLTVIDWRPKRPDYPSCPNLRLINQRISDDELATLMNRCGVHVCPSTTEGFGHTIHEAMSCRAVLITTDAPPMNELTRECAILVRPSRQGTLGLATTHEVDPSHLAAAVRKVMGMSLEQRRELGRRARERWEQNRADFHLGVENMARIVSQRLGQATSVAPAPDKPPLGLNQFRV